MSTLRIGHEGESYPGIRKDDVHVGGRITLVDAVGPFGNPTSDSARTMVTTATTRGLLVVFAPREVDAGAADARDGRHVRADAAVHRLPRGRADLRMDPRTDHELPNAPDLVHRVRHHRRRPGAAAALRRAAHRPSSFSCSPACRSSSARSMRFSRLRVRRSRRRAPLRPCRATRLRIWTM